MIEFIRSRDTVKAWAGKTLDERAIMLHRKFPQTKITGNYIGKLYSRFKIKRKAVVLRKYAEIKVQPAVKQQIKDAKYLLKMYEKQGTKIYYLDECMFTKRCFQGREFASPNDNVTFT